MCMDVLTPKQSRNGEKTEKIGEWKYTVIKRNRYSEL